MLLQLLRCRIKSSGALVLPSFHGFLVHVRAKVCTLLYMPPQPPHQNTEKLFLLPSLHR